MPQDQDRTAAVESLTAFVAERGGSRLIGRRRLARRCCEWVVEENPAVVDAATVREIISRRAGEEYGSVLAAILLPLLLNLISGLIVEWWRRRNGDWLTVFNAP